MLLVQMIVLKRFLRFCSFYFIFFSSLLLNMANFNSPIFEFILLPTEIYCLSPLLNLYFNYYIFWLLFCFCLWFFIPLLISSISETLVFWFHLALCQFFFFFSSLSKFEIVDLKFCLVSPMSGLLLVSVHSFILLWMDQTFLALLLFFVCLIIFC